MAGYREGHRATLLEDGRVVVRRGHRSGDDVMPAPEVWDPTTGTFGSAGSLAPTTLKRFPSLACLGRRTVMVRRARACLTGESSSREAGSRSILVLERSLQLANGP